MLHPNQFEVNEVWIALRVNDSFIYYENEPFDIHVLIDAASCYIMSQALTTTITEAPDEAEFEKMFQKAWSVKKQWPKKLLVPDDDLAIDTFQKQAEKHNLIFEIVPMSDIKSIVGELKESFDTDFLRRHFNSRGYVPLTDEFKSS